MEAYGINSCQWKISRKWERAKTHSSLCFHYQRQLHVLYGQTGLETPSLKESMMPWVTHSVIPQSTLLTEKASRGLSAAQIGSVSEETELGETARLQRQKHSEVNVKGCTGLLMTVGQDTTHTYIHAHTPVNLSWWALCLLNLAHSSTSLS